MQNNQEEIKKVTLVQSDQNDNFINRIRRGLKLIIKKLRKNKYIKNINENQEDVYSTDLDNLKVI